MYFYIIIFFIIIIASVWLAMRSFRVDSKAYLPLLCKSDFSGDKRVVTLTFDDGVDPIQTPKILSILQEHKIKATFFIIGERAKKYPEIVKQIHSAGHLIGNHSYFHRWWFPLQFTRCIKDELKRTREILKSLTGVEVKFFRPPFGVTNPMIGKAVSELELTGVGWSIRSLDTVNTSVDDVLNRIKTKLHPGGVILLHDPCRKSEVLLERLLELLERESYEVKSLEELFNL